MVNDAGRPVQGKTVVTDSSDDIAAVCDEIKALLLAKNLAYGDSALSPVRIFSRADTTEQLRVRIDDKLSRILRGSAVGEDAVLDLIGYLILLRIAQRRHGGDTDRAE